MSDDTERLDPYTVRVATWRVALKSFTSQWFLVPQGTGITAVITHQVHYRGEWLTRISQVFWVATIVLLVAFIILYIARTIAFPKHVLKILSSDIQETASLSSISIAFTTIVQMIALNLTSDWATGWGFAAWVLWWINACMAALCVLIMPYVFTYLEAPGVDLVPPGMLLPMIAALTAASGGGVVCRYGQIGADLQVPVVVVCYLFIGVALPFTLVVTALFLVRLMDGSFPVKEKVYQLMILVGPLGQGSFGFLILGQVVQYAFSVYGNSSFVSASGAMTIGTASQFLGLLTWGYGIFWWAFACIAVGHYLVAAPSELLSISKTLAGWSMVFPMGVYTSGAIELGVVLNSRAFWVWSEVLMVMTIILWLINAAATVVGVFSGTLLGLDGGWRAEYFEKVEAEYNKQEDGDSQEQNGNGNANGNGHINDSNAGLRKRDRA